MKLLPVLTGAIALSFGSLSALAQDAQPTESQNPQAGAYSEPGASTQMESASERSGSIGQMDSDTISAIQESLKEAGHDVGAVDGIWGPKTEAALREFQEARGLEPTGTVDDRTLAELEVDQRGAGGFGAEPEGSAPATGVIDEPDAS